MRLFSVSLLVAMTVVATTTFSDDANRIDDVFSGVGNVCTREGFLGDPVDCTKFYRCVNEGGQPLTRFQFVCGPGTIWDPVAITCNSPSVVQRPECGPLDGEQRSDQNWIFDQIQDLQGQVTYDDEVPPFDQGQPWNNPSWQFPDPLNDQPDQQVLTRDFEQKVEACTVEGFFGDPDDCQRFYECVEFETHFVRYPFTCAAGTVWDQTVQTCNHPWAVEGKCYKPLEFPSEVHSQEADVPEKGLQEELVDVQGQPQTAPDCYPQPPPNDCQSPGFLTDPLDCRKYYRCVLIANFGLIQYGFICPLHTVWDPHRENCYHPSVVQGPCGIHLPTLPVVDSEVETPTLSDSESSTTGTTIMLSDEVTTREEGETSSLADSVTETPTEVYSSTGSSEMSTTTVTISMVSDAITTEEVETSSLSSSETESSEMSTISTFTDSPSTFPSTMIPESTSTTTGEVSLIELTSTESNLETSSESTPYSTPSTVSTELTTLLETGTERTSTESSTTTELMEENGSESISTESSEISTITTFTENPSTFPSTMIPESTTTGEVSLIELTSTESHLETSSTMVDIDSTPSTVSSELTTLLETSTERTSTESSTTTELMEENGSTPISQEGNCPVDELMGNQIALVCPTGFKRHPRFCNMFYQCTLDERTLQMKLLVLACPEDTIFDDDKTQCLSSPQTTACSGRIFKTRTTRMSEHQTSSWLRVAKDQPLCPSLGNHPLPTDEEDESCGKNLFIKCEIPDGFTRLQGYLFECPQNHTYSTHSRRCEPDIEVKTCSSREHWDIPIERN